MSIVPVDAMPCTAVRDFVKLAFRGVKPSQSYRLTTEIII